MIETILFDADGVVISPRKRYFSDRLVTELGVAPEEGSRFVKELLIPSMTGKVDIKEGLLDYIKRWGINKSVDELLEYWWSEEKDFNSQVLGVVDELGQKGLRRYLATDQEKYRAEYLMKELGLAQHFNGAFFSFELGFTKHDIEFWQKVLEALKATDPTKILYWDDDQKNVDVAQGLGITSRFYSDFDSFVEESRKLGVL